MKKQVYTIDLKNTCPHCGRPNDAVTGTGREGPADGDISLCFGCFGWGAFRVMDGKVLSLRKLGQEEIDKIPLEWKDWRQNMLDEKDWRQKMLDEKDRRS